MECEYDCGFTGDHATVEEHEETCKDNPANSDEEEEESSLPSHEDGTIFRIGGEDHELSNGKLVHRFFPDGTKVTVESGYQFDDSQGRGYELVNDQKGIRLEELEE
jgi:hypothetical protein